MSEIGNPYEPGHFDQFRDSKSKRPRDVLYRPMVRPKYSPRMEQLRTLLEELKTQGPKPKGPVFVKLPKYAEPPFFTTPIVKVIETELDPALFPTFKNIFSIPIPGRHELVVTAFGMDQSKIGATNTLMFLLANSGQLSPSLLNNAAINIIEGDPVAFTAPSFALPVGTFARPVPFYIIGVSNKFKVWRNTNFVLQGNTTGGGAGVNTLRIFVSFYISRLEHADEFEQSEYMK
jgi:hypothetical protein